MHTYANVFFCFSPGGDTPPLHTVSASMSVCYVAVCYVASTVPTCRLSFCSAASKLGPQMAGVKLMLDRVVGL